MTHAELLRIVNAGVKTVAMGPADARELCNEVAGLRARAEAAEKERNAATARADGLGRVAEAARAMVTHEESWENNEAGVACVWCGALRSEEAWLHGRTCPLGDIIRALSSAPRTGP